MIMHIIYYGLPVYTMQILIAEFTELEVTIIDQFSIVINEKQLSDYK